jgi:hypothetical protein
MSCKKPLLANKLKELVKIYQKTVIDTYSRASEVKLSL